MCEQDLTNYIYNNNRYYNTRKLLLLGSSFYTKLNFSDNISKQILSVKNYLSAKKLLFSYFSDI